MHASDALLPVRPGRDPFRNGPETKFLEPRRLRAYLLCMPTPLVFDSTLEEQNRSTEKGTRYTIILHICYIHGQISGIPASV